jgi:hypothetical protein
VVSRRVPAGICFYPEGIQCILLDRVPEGIDFGEANPSGIPRPGTQFSIAALHNASQETKSVVTKMRVSAVYSPVESHLKFYCSQIKTMQ